MSYVIHVWEDPVPVSVGDAIRFLDAQSCDRVGQNPKFIELAQKLTAAFPCITTLGPNDATGVWTDGPLDGITDERSFVVGVSQHHWEVRRHIVSCAGKLGLTCFDMQDGLVFLPDGAVLPQGTTLPDKPATRLTEGDLERALHRIVRHAGFADDAQRSSCQWREIHSCKQTIWLSTINRYGQFELSLRLLLKWERHPISLQLAPEFFYDGPDKFLAWDTADAETAMAQLKQFILQVVLPFLDESSTLEGLDRILNDPLRSFNGLDRDQLEAYLSALYVARTVANPRFEKLVASYSARARGYFREFAWLAMQRWVGFLRQEPGPAYPPLDEVMANAQLELHEFVDTYDGARLGQIDYAGNGRLGIGFMDRNLGYRRSVASLALTKLEAAPIALLYDLLVAEARWARGQLWVDRCVAPIAQAILARAGADSFDAVGMALACGSGVLAAIKTIDVKPEQAAGLASACRQRAASASSAKMKARWLDLAYFLERPAPPMEASNIAAFVASYDTSQSHRIAFKWNGQMTAPGGRLRLGKDLNQQLREEVRQHVLGQPDLAPLALVCDLFVAESHYIRNKGAFIDYTIPRTPEVMLLAQTMLTRGGARELELFEMAQVDALDFRWPYDRMALPGGKGPALAVLCRERSGLAACPERKHVYLRLARFFDGIPSEVPPGHLHNYGWRPKKMA